MMIGDAMTPFDPVLLSMLNKSMLNSMLPSFFFNVTRLQIFDVKLVSMLQFSIFPYSMFECVLVCRNFHPVKLGYNDHAALLVTTRSNWTEVKNNQLFSKYLAKFFKKYFVSENQSCLYMCET